MVAREEEVAEPGTYLLVELDDDPLIVVRGRDGQSCAPSTTCVGTAGTAVAEEPCGKVVRFQCPYHAWIYDLDGSLIRAKHTEDLDDFAFEDYGLASVHLETWQGFIFLNLDRTAAPLREQLGDLVEHWSRFDFSTPALGRSASSTRSRPTGSSSPRTTASATTARASTPSSTS